VENYSNMDYRPSGDFSNKKGPLLLPKILVWDNRIRKLAIYVLKNKAKWYFYPKHKWAALLLN
jgi:hypothetical protein